MHKYLLLVSLMSPLIVNAQEVPGPRIDNSLSTCIEKDLSTAGMMRCTYVSYKQWDRELNKNYQALISKLKPTSRQALKVAQLDWMKYRDMEFRLIDSIYDTISGTMYIPMRLDQKMQIVRQRSLALASYLELISESEP